MNNSGDRIEMSTKAGSLWWYAYKP